VGSSNPQSEIRNPQFFVAILRGIAGAAVGGAVGYFAFSYLLTWNLYSLVLPGFLMGMACGWASGRKSQPLGIACAVTALALSLLAEWRHHPFVADRSLGYFLTHVHHLQPLTWIMLVLGVVTAYWFGVGRDRTIASEPVET
jgi:hypothetical protein